MSWMYFLVRSLLGDGEVLRRSGNSLRGVAVADMRPAGAWTPDGNNTRDLGLTGTRWRTAYLGTLLDAPRINMAPAAATSGVRTALTLTGAADTGLTAATEQTDVDLHLGRTVTWAAGAGPLAAQRAIRVRAPTYAGNAGGALTITHASTLEIDNAPQAGPNMTLTNAWAIRVAAGACYFGGAVTMGAGLAVTGDITAAGGFRQTVGVFVSEGVASGDNATPANSTSVAIGPMGLAGAAHVAKRAGSITGLGFHLDADPAGSAIVVAVTINGAVQAATATTLAAGATRYASATFAKDAVPFAAGDRIALAVRTGSGWTATTANLAGDVEIEC